MFGELFGHKLDFADLYFQFARSEAWSLEEGIVKSGSFNIEQGVGVRAISGEKTAFAYSDEISLPALLGAAKTGRETFVAHNGGMKGPFGLRAGTWKFITAGGANPRLNDVPDSKKGPPRPAAPGPHLYDLSKDLGETKNLAKENPDKLKELQDLLAKIRGE